jgi:hypothetical protein
MLEKLNREEEGLISVSCPGGMARQYRVQIASVDTPEGWKHAGTFHSVHMAKECALRLTEAGQQARVLACTALPTAA